MALCQTKILENGGKLFAGDSPSVPIFDHVAHLTIGPDSQIGRKSLNLHDLAGRHYLISMISFSLTAERSSIFFVSLCVSFSSSSRDRFLSSSLIFFSFS